MNGPAERDSTHNNRSPVAETTQAPREHFPFLRAPQGPDELGRLGGYRVLRLLGSGGMGFVFEAEEVSLHRRVALKVLRPELAEDPANRERFLREARAAAAIVSDHVVTIYHVGDGDVPYLAMPFLEGESLQTRIERKPPLTLREALEIARQTAEGLVAAHAAGMTHRDIKPANLWLEANPRHLLHADFPFGRVKLLDFGLARRGTGETSLTSTGFIVGTPNYMSPEQAAGGEVDGRADLFSLGCVLYTVITGELPFQGPSAMAVMMALANKTPPPVNEKNPTVPKAVADLISRLLEKEPSRRPQTAREVGAALATLLAGISGSVPLPLSSVLRLPEATVETPGAGTGATLPPTQLQSPKLPTPVPEKPRRRWSRALWFGLGVAVSAAAAFGVRELVRDHPAGQNVAPEPIVVGVLHSRKGTMAVSEGPVIDSTLMAIEELNERAVFWVTRAGGGGRKLTPTSSRQAEKLLAEEQPAAIFGCWTSASRKAVLEVFYRRNEGLLFYPVQYEGLGQSARVVYLGAAPNQQMIPAVEYFVRPVDAGGLGKKRLYLVGSDYVFPRVAHEIIKDQAKLHEKDGVQVVGETFLPLGADQCMAVVTDIKRKNPDAIINTLNGGTNFYFFRELRAQKVFPSDIPTLSLSITENEVQGLNPAAMAGDYLAASYFQTVDRPESREFLRKLSEGYGAGQVATDPMAAAYTGVHLWALAVEKAGTADPEVVKEAVRGLEYEGVRCRVRVDPENLHAWLPARVGRVRADGLVDVVAGAGSEQPIRPVPYPPTRKREQWDQFLKELQFRWDGKWQPPEKK